MVLKAGFPGHSAAAGFADVRRDLEGLVVRDAVGVMRAGVFPDSLAPLVSGRADMKVNIGAFRAVQNKGGAVLLANEGVDSSVTLAAAPAANKRIDLVYVYQQSTDDADTGTASVFGVVQGAPSASPVVPALPSGVASAIRLATVEMPAGATSTQSAGVVITQVFPYTATAGGVVVVRSVVEMNAWAPADGARVFNIANGCTYDRVGGVWLGNNVEVPVGEFLSMGSNITLASDSRVWRSGKMVWGSLKFSAGANPSAGQNLGTVYAPYRPVQGSLDLPSGMSGATTPTTGFVQISGGSISSFPASTNRVITINFAWVVA